MSTTNLMRLRASRISEAQARVDTAEKAMDAAEALLKTAQANYDALDEGPQKTQAENAVEDAQDQVASAAEVLEYENATLRTLLEGRKSAGKITSLQYLLFGALAVGVLVFLGFGILSPETLPMLANIATARGLITFLIAVVTVTIALILLLSTIVSNSSDRVQRFLDGKDLLFALIGVLGTIVGFYFGQTANDLDGLTLTPAIVTNPQPKSDELVNLAAYVHGGSAPYTYSIGFTPKGIVPDVVNTQSETGLVSTNFKAASVDAATQLSFSILVSDSSGRSAAYNSSQTGTAIELPVN